MAGAVTVFLHTKLKIQELLAGILTMTALYSVNIRIMGRSNTPLIGADTIISKLRGCFQNIGVSLSPNVAALILGLLFCCSTSRKGQVVL